MDSENKTGLPSNEEQRFQMLVNGVTDYAIYMLDPEGIVNSWNAGAQRFKGYRADEIVGRHFSVFYSEEDRQAGVPARALKTALETGKFEAEGWRMRKDGSRFWAHVVIDPIRDQTGRLRGFAKVTRDVTDRMLAQKALQESEQRFRLLVQGVTDYAIYMLSPTGEVTNWNTGAQRIKGYTEDEVIGQHFSRFYTEEDRIAGMPARALKTAAQEGRFEAEGLRQRKDGSKFWAHVVIDPIRDESGKLLGFAKITRDITERKRSQEALERANAALFQAQKMEAIGQLTGGIAHDFNNLLAVVANSLDVLTTRIHAPTDVRVLETMQRAVQRGASLTQQLLSFARQQPLKVDDYNLNAVVGGFESVLRRAVNSSIEFAIDLQEELKSVSVDAARFEAALLNLVVNARDAMPEGGKLSLVTENIDLAAEQVGKLSAGQYVRVTVTDNGTGMPPDVVSRAFEPFFTTKEVGKGTGLGLSQVYGFIAQSGGEVTIDSVLGRGTNVSIYLPASANQAPALRQQMRPDTVLLVEDEPDLLEIAAELFRAIGYEVVTAANAQDAIGILKRNNGVDVLFTDVMMPNGMNGIELARYARQHWPGLKIVIASGYPLPALKADYGNLDGFTFMNKPYRLAELAKKLRAA